MEAIEAELIADKNVTFNHRIALNTEFFTITPDSDTTVTCAGMPLSNCTAGSLLEFTVPTAAMGDNEVCVQVTHCHPLASESGAVDIIDIVLQGDATSINGCDIAGSGTVTARIPNNPFWFLYGVACDSGNGSAPVIPSTSTLEAVEDVSCYETGYQDGSLSLVREKNLGEGQFISTKASYFIGTGIDGKTVWAGTIIKVDVSTVEKHKLHYYPRGNTGDFRCQ